MLEILIFSFVLACYMVFVEPRWFKVKRVRIQTKKKLPKPITILHLSDTHFSGRKSYKDKFFEKLAQEFESDFVVVTGDIIDCNEGIEQAAHLLGNLRARFGKFLVLGNHDYYDYHFFDNVNYHLRGVRTSIRVNNVQKFVEVLKAKGIRVLRDNNHKIDLDGASVYVIGTEDPVTRTVNFQKTLKDVPSNSFNIMLTHVIDSIIKMPEAYVDLVFSGHTHGGQIRFPWIGGFMYGFDMPRKYLEGIHTWKESILCVSRGIGASRFTALRFFCRPEAILMEVVPE
ncbi:MAG: metallophosphoesterase [Candidatus Omnitrophica bacterium]|nr:metallophosphoesterase [Candidatus Omnitrophota bacterium]